MYWRGLRFPHKSEIQPYNGLVSISDQGIPHRELVLLKQWPSSFNQPDAVAQYTNSIVNVHSAEYQKRGGIQAARPLMVDNFRVMERVRVRVMVRRRCIVILCP